MEWLLVLVLVIWIEAGIVAYEIRVSWKIKEVALIIRQSEIRINWKELFFSVLTGPIGLLSHIIVYGWPETLVSSFNREMVMASILKNDGEDSLKHWIRGRGEE